MGNKWYAIEIEDIYDEAVIEDIRILASEGTPVLICDDLEDAWDIVDDEIHVIDEEE